MRLIISKNLKNVMKNNVMLDKTVNKGFKILTDDDLGENKIIDTTSHQDMERYVREHTSGIKYDYEVSDAGILVVSFNEFVNMVEDGYNIIKAEILHPSDYISIEYQREMKKDMRGR